MLTSLILTLMAWEPAFRPWQGNMGFPRRFPMLSVSPVIKNSPGERRTPKFVTERLF